MGSLARGEQVEPGYSDIDLVVACEFPSAPSELETMARLGEWQAQASVFGGLLYNLDCYDVREVPFARAFGGAWEMRFDEEGLCLAGEPLWKVPVRRSKATRRREQLSYALRRWVNTGARLLDPRVPEDAGSVWDAQRLVVDVAALFAGKLAAASADGLLDALPATAEVRARGVEACGAREIHTVLLPAALEILEMFADEVTAGYQSSLSVIGDKPPFTPHPELPLLGRALLGAPFEAMVLLHRGPAPGGYLPVAVAAEGTAPRDAVRVFAERLAGARASLSTLADWCRRPVPLSSKLWSALSVFEPAPFLAAAAASPLWCAGQPLRPPRAPDPDGLEDTLTSSAVQSFSLCRGMALRPGKIPGHRHRVTWDRFALLPALDRALETRTFDLAFAEVEERTVRDAGARVRMLHEFSERHREKLAPLLALRLGE